MARKTGSLAPAVFGILSVAFGQLPAQVVSTAGGQAGTGVSSAFARSSSGGALNSPGSAESCAGCHRAAVAGWKLSRHARAMDSSVFQEALYYTEVNLGAAARETCLGCHSPLLRTTGDASLKTKLSWEGVSCDYCHSVREVSMTGPNPKARLEFTRMRAGPWKDDNPKHGIVFSELHTSSLICAPCHEYRNAFGFPVVTTFSEWQASRYAKEGRPCQSCHMPSVDRIALVQRIVTTPIDQERHSYCQACHLTSATSAGATGAPPATGAGLRQHGRLNLHESADLLTGAIQAKLAAARDGNRVRVNVEVANTAAGHYVPTGSPLRQLVLEVHADTASGQHLVQERVYRRTVADREGRPVEREYIAFDGGARVLADTRLAPDEKRAETFLFDVAPGVETQVSMVFRYSYSPLAKTESQREVRFLPLSTVVR